VRAGDAPPDRIALRVAAPQSRARATRAMATLPRAAPTTAAALLPLPRAAPTLLLAGRAAAARRSRLRARGAPAGARPSWVVASSARAVLGGVARREAPPAPQKPTQQVRMDICA